MKDYCVEQEGHCLDVRCDKCPNRLRLIPPRPRGRMIFLDMDGVLADFEKRTAEILGSGPLSHFAWIYGADVAWREINAVKQFWLSIPMMHDAPDLLWATRHYNRTVLTAVPNKAKADDEACKAQKEIWVAQNISPDMPVITCLTSEKPSYCQPGDVLIDDRNIQRKPWEAKGGIFIMHTSAANSIKALMDYGVI